MDVQTGLVYVAVVVISALVIGFVSVFAMREKSYEEAIAEQRKLPDDLLLGKKEKGKEKKHKNKTGKKVKEKKEEKEDKEEKPEHVQFEETPQILSPEPPIQENVKGSKKKGKNDKVKPILVNKDEPVVVVTEPSPSQPILSQEGNHFDVIQPKDDLELIRSHSRENLHQISQSETVLNKSPKETPTKSKKNVKDKESKKKDDHKEEKKETASNQQVNKEKPKDSPKESKESKETKEPREIIKETIIHVQTSNKESKKIKKKNDILAQIGGDRDGVNYSLLKPLVQKAELSRSEIQFLIDQLLNKQQDNPQEHAEWTESRADPIIKLKKQLADKEKALKDEQEASVSVQNKLLELRAELNGERSRLSASVRQLEEALNAKATEAQTLHTRMQHILESHAAEKQGFSRQIEQLQAKVNEDAAIIVKMQEDQGQTHGQMQQELIAQRKQLEVQFAQMRETENALKAQIAQKHVEYQELQNVNMTMSQELQATCESSTHEIQVLTQQVTIMQEQLMQSESQLQHYKETGERLQDMHRQLEESRRAQSEMEHRIKNMHRHEQELQKQVTWLQSELDAAKANAGDSASLKEEVDKLQSELAKLKSDAPANETTNDTPDSSNIQSQLKAKEEELDNVQVELKKAQSDIKKLEAELTEVRNELKSATSELSRTQEEYKLCQNDLNKCQNMLREAQQILTRTRSECSELELQSVRLKEDNKRISSQLSNIEELQKEVKQLREKNESLSTELAFTTERLAVEDRENGIEEKAQKNSILVVENSNLLAQKDDQLVALKSTLTQKEKELDQLGTQVENLRSEVNNHRSTVSKLQDDLEQQRSKNNDLRRKNWKVMEALNAAESRVKNNTGKTDDVEKLKIEEQEATKALLERIFPYINVSEKSHDQWIKAFEEQVYTALNSLKTDEELTQSELQGRIQSLHAMVKHYKKTIYDLQEGVIKRLQNHIDSEEERHQAQLRQKENEIDSLASEIEDVKRKATKDNETNENEIRSLTSEIQDLKTKVTTESNTPNHELQQQLVDLQTRLAEIQALNSSTKTWSDKSWSDMNKEADGSCKLDAPKVDGPPVTDSPKSEPMLGAQCPIAALEKTLLKNTELENCSLTGLDNLVESRQDIDDISLTSKFASNSCHATDNVLQNSCNPLNGQQHKKHKKKRKGGSGKK